ncbi:MAG: hypothetical protein HY690_13425 [Chloroflexi bacterium]|nr:hypothetical protein [Chloroflexota bacterium]
MRFELWDLTTRNVAGFFDTGAEALEAVRAAVQTHGRAYAEAFGLIREDTRGRSKTIAHGAELVARALTVAPGRGRISA